MNLKRGKRRGNDEIMFYYPQIRKIIDKNDSYYKVEKSEERYSC